MSNYVQDKVIIITGSGGGFGRIVAGKVAALGARDRLLHVAGRDDIAPVLLRDELLQLRLLWRYVIIQAGQCIS